MVEIFNRRLTVIDLDIVARTIMAMVTELDNRRVNHGGFSQSTNIRYL